MSTGKHPLAFLAHRTLALFRTIIRSPPRLFGVIALFVVAIHRGLSSHEAHRKWSLAPIVSVDRMCPHPQYETLIQEHGGGGGNKDEEGIDHPKICLTTLTDEKQKALRTRLFGWRNFDGMLELTWQNKLSYARKHGYHLFDESDQLDKSRPPSWSKIRAVQRLMKEENCTWVFWLDADTVIMNPDKKVEAFLPKDPTKDLLLSVDDGKGFNAGVWLAHNSEWGRNFLQEWWDMKEFVKPTGLAKSGDNDALKHKVGHMPDFDDHILAPPRCTFNSFVQVVPPSALERVSGVSVKEQDWYMAEDRYHKGDLLAHVAGVDNKAETVKLLLGEAT